MRRSLKTTLIGSLAAAGLALSGCASGGSGDGGGEGTEFLTIATGGFSGVYYQIGATMSEMLADQLGSDTSVQATGASVENINLLTSGDAELAFAMADAVTQAQEGSGPFEDSGSVGDLQAIGSLYDQYIQVITTEGTGIETIEDLKGKRVSVGDLNSGVELNARMVVEAYGMSYDDFDADHLAYAEAIDGMRNGQIDAAFVTSGLPNSAVTDLAQTEDVKVLPIDGEGAANLQEKYDFFGEGVVPADVYGTAEDVPSMTIPNVLLVSDALSEDAVYDITAAIYDNLDTLHASHNAAKDITVEKATEGLTAEMHPGAQRYFDEAGQ